MDSIADASSKDDDGLHLQYKVILLGDGAVGKTSIAARFADDHFSRQYKQTIGVDFFLHQVSLPGDVGVGIQLWDIGGQTIGSRMLANYVYGAQAVLLVYDISNYQSFQNLADWYTLVKRVYQQQPGGDGEQQQQQQQQQMPYVALVANKADLTHLRTVKPEKHNQFALENNMYSYYCSAKTGDNVSATFYRVAADLAGVTLSRSELENAAKVVRAEIVKQGAQGQGTSGIAETQDKDRCAIM
eukprot:jgi/Chlat1/7543/Chrsp62S00555